jgi:hypothetical protein
LEDWGTTKSIQQAFWPEGPNLGGHLHSAAGGTILGFSIGFALRLHQGVLMMYEWCMNDV